MSKRTILLITAATAIAVSICAAVYYHDPTQTRWMPKCVFHAATGLDCPSCGSTRALHCLLHGRIAEGIAYNPSILIGWPLLGAMAIFTVKRRYDVVARLGIAYLTLYIMWWIIRNISGV